MSDILNTSITFTDGVPGDVTASKLNNIIPGAVIQPAFIQGQAALTPVPTDKTVFYQSTTGGLGNCTLAQILALTGTVKSVGMTAPSGFTVTGSPVTGSGTLALAYGGSIAANKFLASPDGASGVIALRSITPRDMGTGFAVVTAGAAPSIDWSLANWQVLTPAQNEVLSFTNQVTSAWIILVLQNSGAFTITWPPLITWMGAGTAPVPFIGTSYYRFTKGPATTLGEVLRNA